MGLLDGLLGQVLGGAAQGTPAPRDAMPAGAGGQGALMAILLQLLQQNGGLGGLLSQFQQKGYGEQADSWVSTGGNRPIDADVLSQVLGSGQLDRIAQQPGLFALDITVEALDLLRRYDWPGNVRQLQNALFRAAVLCEGDALTPADFPQIASLGDRPPSASGAQSALHNGGINLFRPDGNLRPLEDIEADVIRLAIGHYRGRMTEVARRLGIGRSTLYRKLGELGIDNAA